MSFDELERALSDHYAPPDAKRSPAPPADLEVRLLAEYERVTPQRRPGVLRFIRGHKPVLAAAASIAFLVGACAMPVEVDTDLGIGLTLVAPAEDELPVEAIAHAAAEGSGAEEISVEASIHDGSVRLQIGLWGADVDAGMVTAQLRDEFPELAHVDIDDEVLEGRVRTNLGGKLMHDIFDRSWADDDVEAARAHVVEALRARGIEGDVEVDVTDVPGGRQIKVGVRQHLGDTDGEQDAPAHGERRIKMERKHFEDAFGQHVEEDVEVREHRVPGP
jgi:hypothetical protein